MNVGEVFYTQNFWYVVSNRFFRVEEISKSGKTFVMVELRPLREYFDKPYNTRGKEYPSSIKYNETKYKGKFSSRGTPQVKVADGYKSLTLWDGESLEFDYND